MNVIKAGYEAITHYVDGYQDHKFNDLVKDLQGLLNNQTLPPEKRQEIAERIAAIESHSKSARSKADLVNLCLNIADFAGSLFGPVGSGLTTLATSKPHRTNQLQRKVKVHKAKKAGGRRIAAKGGGKYHVQSGERKLNPDSQSVKESAITGAMAAAKKHLPSPTSILSGCWSAISSYIY